MRAVVVNRKAPAHLTLEQMEPPEPAPDESLVRVAAFSLNRGEVRRAQAAPDSWRPGWDLTGTVERAAADGSGPTEGTRVVGLMSGGAWAEAVAVPTRSLAVLPEPVTFEVASTLPIAGLTRLAWLAAEEKLEPRISVEESWTRVGEVAHRLMERKFTGKAVLRIEE